jgi:hypothetical protein
VWNGRNRFGNKVKPGYYRFVVSARAWGTATNGGRKDVRLRTGYKIVKAAHTVHRLGRYSYSHSTNCFSRASGNWWWLDSAGCTAWVSYRFKVGLTARNVNGTFLSNRNGPFYGGFSRDGKFVYVRIRAASGAYGYVEKINVNYTTYRKVRI